MKAIFATVIVFISPPAFASLQIMNCANPATGATFSLSAYADLPVQYYLNTNLVDALERQGATGVESQGSGGTTNYNPVSYSTKIGSNGYLTIKPYGEGNGYLLTTLSQGHFASFFFNPGECQVAN